MKQVKPLLIILGILIVLLVGILTVIRAKAVIPLSVKAESYMIINKSNGATYEVNDKSDVDHLNKMLSGRYRLKEHSETFNLVDNPCKYTIIAEYRSESKDTLTNNFATYPEVDANNETVIYSESIHIIDSNTIAIWNEDRDAFWIGSPSKKFDTSYIDRLMTKENETYSGSF